VTRPEWLYGENGALAAAQNGAFSGAAIALQNFAQAINRGGPVVARIQLTDRDGKALPDAGIELDLTTLLLLTGNLNKATRLMVNTMTEDAGRTLPYPPTVDGMTADPRTRH
jgi:hypothetical protein